MCGVLLLRQRIPQEIQLFEGLGEEPVDIGAVEFAHRNRCREDHVRVACAVPCDFIPDVFTITCVGLGGQLVAQMNALIGEKLLYLRA